MPLCHLCGETVDEEAQCFGCTFYICEKHGDAPFGGHEAEDHVTCDVCGKSHRTEDCPT